MKRQAGFTLVELAVVVFLIGLLASLGLSALNAQMASAAISATKKKQDTIKDALIAYLGKYKRLPCPAIDNLGGLEPTARDNTITAGNWDCKAEFGFVPYAELGLPRSAAMDGWENFFSYAVSEKWTLTYSTAAPSAGGATTDVAANAFNVGIPGTFSVNDRSPATNATPTEITQNAKAAVLVVSHGKNGLGALTAKGTRNVSPSVGTDELLNVPASASPWAAPSAFYQREYTDTDVPTYGAFDDVVLWLGANDLIAPLVKDGALKSAEAQWAEQIANINNTLIGDMFLQSRCSPLGNRGNSIPEVSAAIQQSRFVSLMNAHGIPTVDPWGGTLVYTTGDFCRLHKNGRYKTSNCDSNCGTCFSTSIPVFTVTTTTTTPPVTIKTQMLNTVIAANPSLLDGCPSP